MNLIDTNIALVSDAYFCKSCNEWHIATIDINQQHNVLTFPNKDEANRFKDNVLFNCSLKSLNRLN